MEKQTPTSKDVARIAGVSRSTVSRVLSGSAKVGEKARTRVLHAIQDTGYEPDMFAQNLVKQRSQTIALGIFSEENGFSLSSLHRSQLYFYLDVLARIEQNVAQAGYDLLLPSHPHETLTAYVRSLKMRRVAGVLMIAPFPPNECVHALLQAQIPTVFLDAVGQSERATYVKADNVGGMRQAMEHLLELGHRHIALLTGHMVSLTGTERLLGVQLALAHAGVTLDPHLIRPSGFSREEAYRATIKLLDEGHHFTALVAASDIMALSAMRALHERGLRVPEDVSIVGFDDIDFCQDVTPALTTIRPDRDVMSQGAVSSLIDLIKGSEMIKPITAPTTLVVRASTGPVTPNF